MAQIVFYDKITIYGFFSCTFIFRHTHTHIQNPCLSTLAQHTNNPCEHQFTISYSLYRTCSTFRSKFYHQDSNKQTYLPTHPWLSRVGTLVSHTCPRVDCWAYKSVHPSLFNSISGCQQSIFLYLNKYAHAYFLFHFFFFLLADILVELQYPQILETEETHSLEPFYYANKVIKSTMDSNLIIIQNYTRIQQLTKIMNVITCKLNFHSQQIPYIHTNTPQHSKRPYDNECSPSPNQQLLQYFSTTYAFPKPTSTVG